MEYQKLYRSTTNKVFAGVCGGLGEFFVIDPVILRIIFVILALMGGGGLLIYIIIWIVVPYKYDDNFNQPHSSPPPNPEPQSAPKDSSAPFESSTEAKPANTDQYDQHHYRGPIFAGIILITLGMLFLADKFIPHMGFDDLWPIILVVIGLLLLGGAFHRKPEKQ